MASTHCLCLVFAMCIALSLAQASNVTDDGYETFPAIDGSRYKLSSLHLTWSQALTLCQEDGGGSHLVIINSQEEADVVKEMFSRIADTAIEFLLVGINDITTEGTWVTVEGDLVSTTGYDKWAPSQPNNFLDEQNCGSVIRDATYYDVQCDYPTAFICEKPNA